MLIPLILSISAIFFARDASAQAFIEVSGGPANFKSVSLSEIQGAWVLDEYACVSSDFSKIQKRWRLAADRLIEHRLTFTENDFSEEFRYPPGKCQTYSGNGKIRAISSNPTIELHFELSRRSPRIEGQCGLMWSYGENDKLDVKVFMAPEKRLALVQRSGPPYCIGSGVPVTLWKSPEIVVSSFSRKR